MESQSAGAPQTSELRRETGLGGAVVIGLGSIVGTGVFVSIGIAAGSTGPAVVAAILVAALVATCNGLSSAQLAANHPVSGGTYEYGHRWLNPTLGFVAGWTFLAAKSASAATAALGFAGYLGDVVGISTAPGRTIVAMLAVIGVTALVSLGLRRTHRANGLIVGITLGSLTCFVIAMLPVAFRSGDSPWQPFFTPAPRGHAFAGFLEACALMFVAFTGYGRIATMGEEVIEPASTIPRAVVITLVVSALLYGAVGAAAIGAAGASFLAEATTTGAAPLQTVARQFGPSWVVPVIAFGAVTAMLGVLLNLVLGLSRVVLAMGRRGDAPRILGRLNDSGETPLPAVIATGLVIAGVTLIGDVKTTWSFSAFSVLVYYALTNLAATRLSGSERLFPRLVPRIGLVLCLALAFWVETRVWLIGLAWIGFGLAVRSVFRRIVTERDRGTNRPGGRTRRW